MSGGEISENEKEPKVACPFVSIHYIICECGDTFPSENDLRRHLEKEHPHKKERKEYKCGICGCIYSTEEACIEHYEEAHIVKSEPVESDEEDYKGAGLLAVPGEEEPEPPNTDHLQSMSEEQLLYLISNEGGAPAGDPGDRRHKRAPPRTIVCEVCGKKYASNAALKYHQRVHTGEKPYHCTICTKSFTMPLFLQIHVRTHTGERPYACTECPKRFSNKAALMRHDRVHSGIKPYACPMCDKYFTQSNSMKLHVTTVHLKQPAPYKSKNRKLKAELRSQASSKLPTRTRKSPPATSIEVLKNGLEDYVLGPLKSDVEALKNECGDIGMVNVDAAQVDSEIVYEDGDCYVIYE